MTSVPTPRLRLEKQGTGDNPNDWGNRANNVFELLDEAIGGFLAVPVNANVTLTSANYASDQARRAVIRFTGAGGFTVTFPTAEKLYFIDNQCAADVLVTTAAGTNATVLKGTKRIVYCDGTNMVTDTTVTNSATAIAFDPAGNLAATTVQNAIQELDTEKVAKAGDVMTGALTAPTFSLDANAYLARDGGGDPVLAFDTGDYIRYLRSPNIKQHIINNVIVSGETATDFTMQQALTVEGRRVTGCQVFNAAAGGLAIPTVPAIMCDLTVNATGTQLLVIGACRASNAGPATDIVYGMSVYDRTAGDTLLYTLTRVVTASASVGGTAVIAFPLAGLCTPGRVYLVRMQAYKNPDNGAAITAYDIRIDGFCA